MIGITVVPFGLTGLIAEFARARHKMEDNRIPFQRAIEKIVVSSITETFTTGGRPERWAPLNETTVRIKGNNQPLIASGALFAAATDPKNWEVTKDSASFTLPEDVSYGNIHQEGAPNAGIPARPFMMLQAEDMDRIAKVFDEWIGEII